MCVTTVTGKVSGIEFSKTMLYEYTSFVVTSPEEQDFFLGVCKHRNLVEDEDIVQVSFAEEIIATVSSSHFEPRNYRRLVSLKVLGSGSNRRKNAEWNDKQYKTTGKKEGVTIASFPTLSLLIFFFLLIVAGIAYDADIFLSNRSRVTIVEPLRSLPIPTGVCSYDTKDSLSDIDFNCLSGIASKSNIPSP